MGKMYTESKSIPFETMKTTQSITAEDKEDTNKGNVLEITITRVDGGQLGQAAPHPPAHTVLWLAHSIAVA